MCPKYLFSVDLTLTDKNASDGKKGRVIYQGAHTGEKTCKIMQLQWYLDNRTFGYRYVKTAISITEFRWPNILICTSKTGHGFGYQGIPR